MLIEVLEDCICSDCPTLESCEYNCAPLCDLEFKINRIIVVIADDIERISISASVPIHDDELESQYLSGAEDEHAYIVEYLRGLLDI